MDEEQTIPRTEEEDLVEITARLGEPEAVHRTNSGSVALRASLGMLIILGGASLHFVMWSGVIGWPKGAKLWVLILAGMFVGPGLGIYLISFAMRGRKLWVLLYPNGLFLWHRGHVRSFPWDEIRFLQLSGLPEKSSHQVAMDNRGWPDSAWFDLERSRVRVFGTTITLTRADGEQAILYSTLDGFAELSQRVQQESFRRLFPAAWESLQQGIPCVFGTMFLTLEQLSHPKVQLPWSRVDRVARVADQLHVFEVGRKRPRLRIELSELTNLHVLLALVEVLRSRAAGH